MNTLYFGDNLDILRKHVASESVDLIYLDPPFKSDQNYNILFTEKNGSRSKSQIKAFNDTWHWDLDAIRAFEEIVERGGKVSEAMQAFRQLVGCNDMLAYLSMMGPRLVELRRVLKPTGSIYIHCDAVASHYLKLLMDAIFGVANFQNEIVWKRTSAHSSAKRWGPVHDVLLFYSASENYKWNKVYQEYDPHYTDAFYHQKDDDGRRYTIGDLTGAGVRQGESGKEWRGINPTDRGRHWAVPRKIPGIADIPKSPLAALDYLDKIGRIAWPARGGMPRFKRYLDDMAGVQIQDIIDDIAPLSAQARERLGYPTQKPQALLERIIEVSSARGDIVLDPFCGCGTTVSAAQKMRRRWIGIDITHLAITLIKHRLQASYGDELNFKVIGEPVSITDAEALAKEDPYQFQWWALGLVGARPTDEKKGADRGIDGRLYFHDESGNGKTKQIIISVKSGTVTLSHIRDLRGVLDREKAAIGVMISLLPFTRGMRSEAASSGYYDSLGWHTKYPRLQLFMIEELLAGKKVDRPPTSVTFKDAPRHRRKDAEEMGLGLND